ncbi:riboflavin biosynthesis protein RibD, partial [Streptomyces sp. SID7803]|nr:riboflavin biosynthesis protein RibD [Streptomyces sp. SID7803]
MRGGPFRGYAAVGGWIPDHRTIRVFRLSASLSCVPASSVVIDRPRSPCPKRQEDPVDTAADTTAMRRAIALAARGLGS